MRKHLLLMLSTLMVGLAACSSGAPRAPLGWNKQPANPPAAVDVASSERTR
ncbi:hypothetical protein [Asticcacaulis sp. W401b]|uniref:hypothetical protein n=1 Tax=Asticcacaulis sp. W401b TaxID=3388666 RepID=UPI003970678B